MLNLRFIPLAVIVAVGNCGKPDPGDEGGEDPLVEMCEQNCYKALCDGALDPDLDTFEQTCNDVCTQQVDDAATYECTDAYVTFQECLDSLHCNDYFEWFRGGEGVPCSTEEQDLETACPELVPIHDENN